MTLMSASEETIRFE